MSTASTRRAVIDIGTNSVKLLVANVTSSDQVHPLLEQSRQTRLGRGFYEANRLQIDAIAQTAEVVADFIKTAQTWAPDSIRIIATSAVRDSTNQAELLEAIYQATGKKVEVLSGDLEADWVYQGVTTDPALNQGPMIILDVGGGSTEFILGASGNARFSHSYPIGSVRLLERFPVSDPPQPSEQASVQKWLDDFLATEVKPKIEHEMATYDPQSVGLVGTGGTITILARIRKQLDRFDREQIEASRLTHGELAQLLKRLWESSLEARKQIVGLPPKRADVILMGSLIYEAVMRQFGFEAVRVSTRGLRFAALLTA